MIIRRAILKELLTNFVVVVLFLSSILFMERFVRLTRIIMGKGTEIVDILKVFVYLQPSILILALPIAILIAIFLTYGRMSTDNEMVVLKGSGMSLLSLSRPAIVLSVAGFVLLLFISTYVFSRSMLAFKRTVYQTIMKKASVTIEEGTFSRVFEGTVIFVKDMSEDDRFRGIFIYREGDTREPLVIVAEEGSISANPEEGVIKLSMRNGVLHTFNEMTSSEATFSVYDFVLAAAIEPLKELKPYERGIIELWKDRNRGTKWEVELNRRLALPFACLIFGFLGPAFSTRIGKTGRLGGFSFSLFFLILYYVILIFGESLAKAQKIPPFWGGWMPNIVFGSLTILFFHSASRDKHIFRKRSRVRGRKA